jgi:hypothetical protein
MLSGVPHLQDNVRSPLFTKGAPQFTYFLFDHALAMLIIAW